jgi:hypothetical protein
VRLKKDEICREDNGKELWKWLSARFETTEKPSHYIGTGVSTYTRILRETNYDLPPSRDYNDTWMLVKRAFHDVSLDISHFTNEGSDSGGS